MTGSPLRVAMLTQRYLPFTGGAEHQLAALLRRLPDHGIAATVITRRHDDSPKQELVEAIPVCRIETPGPRVAASLVYTARALAALRRFRPQVVHAFELLSPSTTALAYKAAFGTPVVAKVLRGGTLGDIAVLRRGGGIGALRLKLLSRRIDAFAVISNEIDVELAALGVPRSRRHFIPNGVDFDRYRPAGAAEKKALRARLGLPDGPIALFAGRLEHEKRIDRLAALWPRLRATLPGATLVAVGTGSLAPQLAAAGPGVIAPGPQSDMRSWYGAADAFVLPSEAEGLSNALLEAMAMGLECVVTEVGAARELLDDGLGHLVQVDDDAGLLAALVAALRDPQPADSPSGIRRRQRVTEHYSLDSTARRLAGLYRSLAAPAPGAGTPG